MQISDPALVKLVRQQVKEHKPYVGIFLKKDENNESEVVKDLSEIYDIGTFAHIHEVHDHGDKLRLVATAHRRIKISRQIPADSIIDPKRKSLLYLSSLY